MDQRHRFFAPLIGAAAISVVAFSGIGVAAITGHLPIARSALNPFAGLGYVIPSSHAGIVPGQMHQGLTRKAGEAPATGKPVDFRVGEKVNRRQLKCVNCGVVDSITIQQPATADGQDPGQQFFNDRNSTGEESAVTSFVIKVKMENGTVRIIRENQRPSFSVGERVRLVNGTMIPQS